MSTQRTHWRRSLAVAAVIALGGSNGANAQSSAAEAEQLKTTLTPFGAEKAGNKEGSIPAWTGGYTAPNADAKTGGRLGDPFAAEKPLYSITAKNMAQYADKLSDGSMALLKRYPESYRIDVYPTHRTGTAPQWVYDNTFKNATRAKLVEGVPEGAFGGTPFPIPKAGLEVLWNHLLRWRGEAYYSESQGVQGTTDGKKVTTVISHGNFEWPYYFKDAPVDKFDGDYTVVRILFDGPPVRAGEGLVTRINLSAGDQTWVYLTGQRRVRKLPNSCCDSPTPQTAGVLNFDEVEVFNGKPSRFDWKLIGKKEMIVPYNGNRLMQPTKNDQVLAEHHVNPDAMRWELHRVWVVQADLKAGQRHQSPKSVYYFDEDTWAGLLGDRWDARGQLARSVWESMVVLPEVPATASLTFGFYDMVSGAWYVSQLLNESAVQYRKMPRYADSVFTPDGLISEGVR